MFQWKDVECPKCGKIFLPAPMHIYHDHGKLYCCWTCYKHRNDNVRGKSKRVLMFSPDGGEPIKVFESARKAGIYMDSLPRLIQQACREQTKYKGYIWMYEDNVKRGEQG